MPEAVSIFILPPSIQVLQQRLQARGEDSEASIARRLAEAQREISQAHKYQYIIVNHDFEQAVTDLLSICRASRLRAETQISANDQVKAILSDS